MSPEEFELLGAILVGTPSLPRAACKGRSEVFDGTHDDDAIAALRICHTCPEQAACNAWAQTLPPNGINGVVGGAHRIWVSHRSELGRRQPVTLAGGSR